MTLQAYLDHRAMPASVRREVLAWWSISGSGAPDKVGAAELLTAKLAKGLMVKLEELAFTVESGVAGISRRAALASRAEVILGDAVERLEDRGTGVRVSLDSGRVLEAKAALVAVPLNVLSQIRFSPPLAAAQQRLRDAGHAGRALKLLIRARGPEPGTLATGETAGLRWIYADRRLPDGNTLLIAFGLRDDMPEPDRAGVETALAAAFPGADLVDFDWHDWTTDPFARGTWVAPRLASLPDYEAGHWGLCGRVAFAGSDLYSAEQGWMEGALLTARAAAAALDARLQQDP
jgi:monoamine oxidase